MTCAKKDQNPGLLACHLEPFPRRDGRHGKNDIFKTGGKWEKENLCFAWEWNERAEDVPGPDRQNRTSLLLGQPPSWAEGSKYGSHDHIHHKVEETHRCHPSGRLDRSGPGL